MKTKGLLLGKCQSQIRIKISSTFRSFLIGQVLIVLLLFTICTTICAQVYDMMYVNISWDDTTLKRGNIVGHLKPSEIHPITAIVIEWVLPDDSLGYNPPQIESCIDSGNYQNEIGKSIIYFTNPVQVPDDGIPFDCSIRVEYPAPLKVELLHADDLENLYINPALETASFPGFRPTITVGSQLSLVQPTITSSTYPYQNNEIGFYLLNIDFITGDLGFYPLGFYLKYNPSDIGGSPISIETFSMPSRTSIPHLESFLRDSHVHITFSSDRTPPLGDYYIEIVITPTLTPSQTTEFTFNLFDGRFLGGVGTNLGTPTSITFHPVAKFSSSLPTIEPCMLNNRCVLSRFRPPADDEYVYTFVLSLFDDKIHTFAFEQPFFFEGSGLFPLTCRITTGPASILVVDEEKLRREINIQLDESPIFPQVVDVALECNFIVSHWLLVASATLSTWDRHGYFNPLIPQLHDLTSGLNPPVPFLNVPSLPDPSILSPPTVNSQVRPLGYGLSTWYVTATALGPSFEQGFACEFKYPDGTIFDANCRSGESLGMNDMGWNDLEIELFPQFAGANQDTIKIEAPKTSSQLFNYFLGRNDVRDLLGIDRQFLFEFGLNFTTSSSAPILEMGDFGLECDSPTSDCASYIGNGDGLNIEAYLHLNPTATNSLLFDTSTPWIGNLQSSSTKRTITIPNRFAWTPEIQTTRIPSRSPRYIARPRLITFSIQYELTHKAKYEAFRPEAPKPGSLWPTLDKNLPLQYAVGTNFWTTLRPYTLTISYKMIGKITSQSCFGRNIKPRASTWPTNPFSFHESFDLNFLGLDEAAFDQHNGLGNFPTNLGPDSNKCTYTYYVIDIEPTLVNSIQVEQSLRIDTTLTWSGGASTNLDMFTYSAGTLDSYNWIGGHFTFTLPTIPSTPPTIENSTRHPNNILKVEQDFPRGYIQPINDWAYAIWDKPTSSDDNIRVTISLEANQMIQGTVTATLKYYPVTSSNEDSWTKVTYDTRNPAIVPNVVPVSFQITPTTQIGQILLATLIIPPTAFTDVHSLTKSSSVTDISIPQAFIEFKTVRTDTSELVQSSLSTILKSMPLTLINSSLDTTTCSQSPCSSLGTDRCFTTDLFIPRQPKCLCKAGWNGALCDKKLAECSPTIVEARCHNNGVIAGLSPQDITAADCKDVLKTFCSCTGLWLGTRCTYCPLVCENQGRSNNQCNRCQCGEGYSGDRCQCKSIRGTIGLNALNEVVTRTGGVIMVGDNQHSVFNSTSLQDISSPYSSIKTDDHRTLHAMMTSLANEITKPLTGTDTGKIALSVQSLLDKNLTKFTIYLTYGCDEFNPQFVTGDDVTSAWNNFVPKFIQLDGIRHNFPGIGGIQDSSSTDPPIDHPPAKAPSPPEGWDDEEKSLNGTSPPGWSFAIQVFFISSIFISIFS